MSGFSLCNRIKRSLGAGPLILYSSDVDVSDAAIEAYRQTCTSAHEYLSTARACQQILYFMYEHMQGCVFLLEWMM